MISDSLTNFLYLSSLLRDKHPSFANQLAKILKNLAVPFAWLPQTNDIWAVDYMPIQVATNHFVQFEYSPDYLKSKKWRKTISNVTFICKVIGIHPKKSNIILDGGNLIKHTDKAILTEKIFEENPKVGESQLIEQLKNTLHIEKIYFIPWDKSDYTGHADGMVRFINGDTVFVNNDYTATHRGVRLALQNAGFQIVGIPYTPND